MNLRVLATLNRGMGRLSQPDKVKAIAALALTVGVIALGEALAIVSHRQTPGAGVIAPVTATPGSLLPTPSPEPSAAAPTPLPFSFEGVWDLDFAASGLVGPTLGPEGPGIGSNLILDRGRVQFTTGYGGGCDLRTGTFTSDGLALTISLGPNTDAGCNEPAIDEVTARFVRVVAVALASCPAGYILPSGLPAPTDGTCRQLWLLDHTNSAILVYAAAN